VTVLEEEEEQQHCNSELGVQSVSAQVHSDKPV
jgi:hypothetical protein